jgi:pimeloyl-ACP methyl ester carboxylesterase
MSFVFPLASSRGFGTSRARSSHLSKPVTTTKILLLAVLSLLVLTPRLTARELPTPALPPMQSIDVYGQTIRYYELGTGPDLVLLHGLGSSASFDWGQLMLPLSQHYHVLAMDQLGFGSSAKPLVAYGVPTWVDMLAEFLRLKNVQHFTLGGESLGGWIATEYTIESLQGKIGPAPERLILSDAAGHRSLLKVKGKIFAAPISLAGQRAGLSTVFYDKSLLTDAFLRQNFVVQLGEGADYTVNSFWTTMTDSTPFVDGRLGAITIPTLIIWGEEDELIPLADGKDFAKGIKGSKLVIVPECGHGTPIEKADAFLKALQDFMATSAGK